MKVFLINPPNREFISANVPVYISDSNLPPLGLLYIATALKQNPKHSVKICDAAINKLTYEQIARQAASYDAIGITVVTFLLPDVIEIVKAIRKINKTVPIILGGPHLAVYPKESMELEGVTYCLSGECDNSFVKLVDALSNNKEEFESIPGLHWEENGEIKNNTKGEFIDDLDQLPIPDRRLLDYKLYNSVLSHPDSKTHLTTTMFSSRGCPYECIFCDRPNMGKKFRYHCPGRIIAEIQDCISLGIDEIIFYDDTFTVITERVREICELILQKRLTIKWDIRARVNNMSYELLSLMRRAGCSRIHFGVESGNDEVLKTLKKGITRKLAKEAFSNARKAGLETLGYFMFGCPNENLSQMQDTLDFSLELNPDYAHFSILTPYPGTPVYLNALKEGLFEEDYWREYSRNPVTDFIPKVMPNTLPREELIDILKRAYKKFYMRPNYILKQMAKVNSWGDFSRKASIAGKILAGKR